MLLSALAFGVSSAAATEPPVLESLSISPTAVNVTGGSEQVTVTAHITDTGGPGVGYAFLALFSPSRHQQLEPRMALVSGTDTDGTYSSTLEIPQDGETGAWKARMRMVDIQGNEAEITAPELEAKAFPNTVEVEGLAAAAEPPALQSLSISPTAVNVTGGSEQVTVTAHITDTGGPGVGYAFLALFSPSRHQQLEPRMALVSGTDTDGTYSSTLEIPQDGETGAWKARMRMVDAQGEEAEITAPELEAKAFPNTVEVSDESEGESEDVKVSTRPPGTLAAPLVAPLAESDLAQPAMSLAVARGASVKVGTAGVLSLTLSAPAGDTCSSCQGTVILRTSAGHGPEAPPMTLASGSFTTRNGQLSTVRLYLTPRGRRLLARLHDVRTVATVTTHEASGAALETSTSFWLRGRAPRARRAEDASSPASMSAPPVDLPAGAAGLERAQ